MVLRRNPRPTFGLALAIMSIVMVASLALVGIVTFAGVERTLSASDADAAAIEAGAAAGTILSALFAVVLSLIGGALLQGIVSLEVARGAVGERLRLRGLWAAAKGRIWALIGWSGLVTVAVVVGISIIAGAAVLLFMWGETAGIVIGVLVMLVGILGGVFLAAWLGTFFAFVPSALMIERLPLGQAIRRSWSLVKGSFWRTFGILLLIMVIVNTVSSVVTAPLSFIGGLGVALLNPTGDEDAGAIAFVALYIVTIIVSVVISAVTIVIQSAAPALLYIDMRMRKEGFDLELSRFVEARNAGDFSVPDPYLTLNSSPRRTPEASPYTAS
ncbi:glycerophosphoryl diester phosphodiesterase membrane domain-containing protein [Salinibacterium sp. NK8237]|nr:glycerophosphoryl diester phosphodiesterase membrane domain-containing protein [Salinibacterium sp. NK8237]